jgi:NTP pyrophosphatase (non-canonical NTP hydrolase)
MHIRDFTEANVKRLPHFKNAKGEPAHTEEDGSDWSLSDWSNALAGEVGEAANIIKKIRRGDVSLEEIRGELGKEFADILAYLVLLAYQAGVDLEDAAIEKWNDVSERVGYSVRLSKGMAIGLPEKERQELNDFLQKNQAP